MQLQKRTYSIDQRLLRAFERSVATGSRSQVINQLLRNYLAEREKESIRTALVRGAAQMNDLYREESEAWYPLEEELYGKTAPSTTPPRRYRSRTVRPSQRA